MRTFPLSLIGCTFLLSSILANAGSPPTILNGLPVLRVNGILSASSVELVIIPKGNQTKRYVAIHPADGRKEEVPGYGVSGFDMYSLLIRDAELDAGPNKIIKNLIIPNIMTEANYKEKLYFFESL